MVFVNNYKNNCFHSLPFVFGVEESEDEPLHLEAQDEDPGVDSTQHKAGRRRRGAWGRRKHAATVEAAAYRIVSCHTAMGTTKMKKCYTCSLPFFSNTHTFTHHTFVCSAL